MCNCIAEVNAKLAERNTQLTIPIILRFMGDPPAAPSLIIQTEQIETGRGKQKATTMFASFCPFCGRKYVAEEVAAEAVTEDPELSRTCYRGKTVEDGEIVLVHWPEGYRLRYHGETVWREPEVPKPDLTAN